MPTTTYIGIGANLGDAVATVKLAIARLATIPATALGAQSSLYLSAPIDSGGDDYINAVVELQTELSAHALLHQLQAIEHHFGRERPYHNAPRTLDLDVLLYGDDEINDSELTVPHPRMTERGFVLLPLLEIMPHCVIPSKGEARLWLNQVSDQAIRRID